MTSQTYPGGNNSFNYQYDPMGNLSAITGLATASYNFAGQLTNLYWTGGSVQETRGYDGQLRLTSIVTGGYSNPLLNEAYVYSSNADNGRISKTVNGLSGETVTYSYDAINRLASATASNGSWVQQYSYDGFGNLTGVNGASIGSVDPATNRMGATDANGNSSAGTFDVENRMVQGGQYGGYTYTYDPWGKRVGQSQISQPDGPRVSTVYFYGITGQRLQGFLCTTDDGSGSCGLQGTNVYFGRKLIVVNGVNVATDRLGSVRASAAGKVSYYPYGQERAQSNGQTTADGTEKFATYFRDGSGQDYADQRYYNQAGRFFSPDPGGVRTANAGNPGSWNRYSYANGDPANFADPGGTAPCSADMFSDNPCPALAAGGDGGNDPCDPSVAAGNELLGIPPEPCFDPAGPGPPTPTASRPTAQCSYSIIAQDARGQDVFVHTLIQVNEGSGFVDYQAFPVDKPDSLFPSLMGGSWLEEFTSTGVAPGKVVYSDSGPQDCSIGAGFDIAAASWKPKTTTYFATNQNSNSFVAWMLDKTNAPISLSALFWLVTWAPGFSWYPIGQ